LASLDSQCGQIKFLTFPIVLVRLIAPETTLNTPEPDTFEDENEAPATRFRPEIAWGFLVFHRRSILGAILIFSVGYFLWTATSKQNDSDDASASTDRISSNSAVPKNLIGYTGVEAASLPDAEKSTEDLIEMVLESAKSWRSETPATAATPLKRRLKNLSILLSRELPATQREFCLVSYIETVGFLSAIDERGGLNLEGVDAAVQEIDELYGNHPNTLIAAKANLACLRAAMDDFLSQKIGLKQVESEIDERRDKICASPVTVRAFADLLVAINRLAGYSSETKKIGVRNLWHIATIDRLVAQKMALDIFFNDLEVGNLAVRVRQKSSDSDSDVEALFEAIEEFPNFSVNVYSVAASSIRSYQIIGQEEKADLLLDQLRKIAPTITFEDVRSEVERGIGMLEDTAAEQAASLSEVE
jgi:hypothetical protein